MAVLGGKAVVDERGTPVCDQEAFFKEYAEAHVKMSGQGAIFDPPGGFLLPKL